MVDPYATINELSGRIRERSVSPVAVVDACLARIAALNSHLNAFITVDAEGARAAAASAESEVTAGRWRGLLHGVPVAVKDFYDTAGLRTTAAFERFANRIPGRDAEVVTRLKNAGAIVIGKTNMDTLGMATTGRVSFYGPVKNPWNADTLPVGHRADRPPLSPAACAMPPSTRTRLGLAGCPPRAAASLVSRVRTG
jgi:aspartyl-tRNA(Asn)/glutamyl-tRNA(Gln) amidotransferase subunit A